MSSIKDQVERLLVAYARCIDNDELESWPEFFTEDADYRVIPRENFDAGFPICVMSCIGRGMFKDRVVAHRTANIFPVHRSRHILSSPFILSESGGLIKAETSYVVLQTRNDGETKVFNAGVYVDEIVREGDELKFKIKHCVFDTNRIETLLVTPV